MGNPEMSELCFLQLEARIHDQLDDIMSLKRWCFCEDIARLASNPATPEFVEDRLVLTSRGHWGSWIWKPLWFRAYRASRTVPKHMALKR